MNTFVCVGGGKESKKFQQLAPHTNKKRKMERLTAAKKITRFFLQERKCITYSHAYHLTTIPSSIPTPKRGWNLQRCPWCAEMKPPAALRHTTRIFAGAAKMGTLILRKLGKGFAFLSFSWYFRFYTSKKKSPMMQFFNISTAPENMRAGEKKKKMTRTDENLFQCKWAQTPSPAQTIRSISVVQPRGEDAS